MKKTYLDALMSIFTPIPLNNGFYFVDNNGTIDWILSNIFLLGYDHVVRIRSFRNRNGRQQPFALAPAVPQRGRGLLRAERTRSQKRLQQDQRGPVRSRTAPDQLT